MSAVGATVAVVIFVVLAAGAYFAYQQGYFDRFLERLPTSISDLEEIQQLGEIVQGGEPEVGESSILFFTNNVQIAYSTLFPNPRWNHMPIRFYLNKESGAGLSEFGDDDLDFVRQALKVWEEKTNSTISFQEVGSLEEGELVVSWFPSLAEIKGGKVVGEGGPSRAIDTGGAFTLIEEGEVFLLPAEDKCTGVNRPVHEIGHVLGLGHSPEGYNDIMFSKEVSCEQNITQITVDAISELYKIPAAADLVITNVSATKKGSLIDINLTVRNIGLKDSLQTKIGFLGDGELIKSLSDPQISVIPRVTPGSGLTSRITNARVPLGLSEIVVKVDYPNDIAEMIEENNEARVYFSK